MSNYQPYTYFLKWTSTGMKYYGARWARRCHPSDLFVTYFTSSSYVKDYISKYGLPDVIQIRKVFADHVAVQKWENAVIRRLNAVSRDDYLNKNSGSKGWNPSDVDIRLKISKARSGQSVKDETKEKIANRQRQIVHTPEWNEKVSKALKGRKHSAERIAALKAGHAKLPVIECPHCQTRGKGPNMTRYHYDNCRFMRRSPLEFETH